MPLYVVDIHAVDKNFTAAACVQPLQQLHKAGFAGTGGAENSNGFAALCSEGDVLKDFLSVLVAEINMAELNVAVNFRSQCFPGFFFGGDFKNLVDSAERDACLAKVGKGSPKLTNGPDKH